MSSIVVTTLSLALAIVFMVMWIRTRRASQQAETVAYGLRAQDDHDETTRTNLTAMNAEHEAAMAKLAQLGQVQRDERGRWIWSESRRLLG